MMIAGRSGGSVPVVPAKRDPRARLRLFCLPYAGGGASIFRDWTVALPSEVVVHPIQLPGREGRLDEPPPTEIHSLMQSLAKTLEGFLDLPFAIFGHSFGALIGFELARLLRAQYAAEPVHLFTSACRSPQSPHTQRRIGLLSDELLLDALQRRYGAASLLFQYPELRPVLLPTIRADILMHETYVYQDDEPLSCPISVFGGLHDTEILYQDLRAWRVHTRSTFSLRMLPGGHLFLHAQRSRLLRTVRDDLIRHFGTPAGDGDDER